MEVDWTYGGEHMWITHRVTIAEANEALADIDAQFFDPNPKGSSGISARALGYSPTAEAVSWLFSCAERARSAHGGARMGGEPIAPTDELIEKGFSYERQH